MLSHISNMGTDLELDLILGFDRATFIDELWFNLGRIISEKQVIAKLLVMSHDGKKINIFPILLFQH